ncbi:hypothetical protein MTP99_002681 [Tenebrio molitor]|nr:hypothetical protein MTP99_002681 [Tenebrio molitor]
MAQHNGESLLRSAKEGKLELVKEYWSKTENGNATNAAGIALILSIVNGHFDVFKFLVDAGVDLNLVNNIESSLPNSNKYNYIKEYKGDASFLSGTALICAVKKYDFRMVQYLVNKGASVNVTDKDDSTNGTVEDAIRLQASSLDSPVCVKRRENSRKTFVRVGIPSDKSITIAIESIVHEVRISHGTVFNIMK